MNEAERQTTELELMAQIAAGDARALGLLYDRHARALLGLAKRIVGDRAEAEDVVHDVFVDAFRQASSFDPRRGGVFAWLAMRVRSKALDRYRAAAVRQRWSRSGQGAPAPAQVETVHDKDRALVARAFGALPQDQRTVLELAYFEGLTCVEIAQALSVPVGTAKSRLAAGLSKLRAAVLDAKPSLIRGPASAAPARAVRPTLLEELLRRTEALLGELAPGRHLAPA